MCITIIWVAVFLHFLLILPNFALKSSKDTYARNVVSSVTDSSDDVEDQNPFFQALFNALKETDFDLGTSNSDTIEAISDLSLSTYTRATTNTATIPSNPVTINLGSSGYEQGHRIETDNAIPRPSSNTSSDSGYYNHASDLSSSDSARATKPESIVTHSNGDASDNDAFDDGTAELEFISEKLGSNHETAGVSTFISNTPSGYLNFKYLHLTSAAVASATSTVEISSVLQPQDTEISNAITFSKISDSRAENVGSISVTTESSSDVSIFKELMIESTKAKSNIASILSGQDHLIHTVPTTANTTTTFIAIPTGMGLFFSADAVEAIDDEALFPAKFAENTTEFAAKDSSSHFLTQILAATDKVNSVNNSITKDSSSFTFTHTVRASDNAEATMISTYLGLGISTDTKLATRTITDALVTNIGINIRTATPTALNAVTTKITFSSSAQMTKTDARPTYMTTMTYLNPVLLFTIFPTTVTTIDFTLENSGCGLSCETVAETNIATTGIGILPHYHIADFAVVTSVTTFLDRSVVAETLTATHIDSASTTVMPSSDLSADPPAPGGSGLTTFKIVNTASSSSILDHMDEAVDNAVVTATTFSNPPILAETLTMTHIGSSTTTATLSSDLLTDTLVTRDSGKTTFKFVNTASNSSIRDHIAKALDNAVVDSVTSFLHPPILAETLTAIHIGLNTTPAIPSSDLSTDPLVTSDSEATTLRIVNTASSSSIRNHNAETVDNAFVTALSTYVNPPALTKTLKATQIGPSTTTAILSSDFSAHSVATSEHATTIFRAVSFSSTSTSAHMVEAIDHALATSVKTYVSPALLTIKYKSERNRTNLSVGLPAGASTAIGSANTIINGFKTDMDSFSHPITIESVSFTHSTPIVTNSDSTLFSETFLGIAGAEISSKAVIANLDFESAGTTGVFEGYVATNTLTTKSISDYTKQLNDKFAASDSRKTFMTELSMNKFLHKVEAANHASTTTNATTAHSTSYNQNYTSAQSDIELMTSRTTATFPSTGSAPQKLTAIVVGSHNPKYDLTHEDIYLGTKNNGSAKHTMKTSDIISTGLISEDDSHEFSATRAITTASPQQISSPSFGYPNKKTQTGTRDITADVVIGSTTFEDSAYTNPEINHHMPSLTITMTLADFLKKFSAFQAATTDEPNATRPDSIMTEINETAFERATIDPAPHESFQSFPMTETTKFIVTGLDLNTEAHTYTRRATTKSRPESTQSNLKSYSDNIMATKLVHNAKPEAAMTILSSSPFVTKDKIFEMVTDYKLYGLEAALEDHMTTALNTVTTKAQPSIPVGADRGTDIVGNSNDTTEVSLSKSEHSLGTLNLEGVVRNRTDLNCKDKDCSTYSRQPIRTDPNAIVRQFHQLWQTLTKNRVANQRSSTGLGETTWYLIKSSITGAQTIQAPIIMKTSMMEGVIRCNLQIAGVLAFEIRDSDGRGAKVGNLKFMSATENPSSLLQTVEYAIIDRLPEASVEYDDILGLLTFRKGINTALEFAAMDSAVFKVADYIDLRSSKSESGVQTYQWPQIVVRALSDTVFDIYIGSDSQKIKIMARVTSAGVEMSEEDNLQKLHLNGTAEFLIEVFRTATSIDVDFIDYRTQVILTSAMMQKQLILTSQIAADISTWVIDLMPIDLENSITDSRFRTPVIVHMMSGGFSIYYDLIRTVKYSRILDVVGVQSLTHVTPIYTSISTSNIEQSLLVPEVVAIERDGQVFSLVMKSGRPVRMKRANKHLKIFTDPKKSSDLWNFQGTPAVWKIKIPKMRTGFGVEEVIINTINGVDGRMLVEFRDKGIIFAILEPRNEIVKSYNLSYFRWKSSSTIMSKAESWLHGILNEIATITLVEDFLKFESRNSESLVLQKDMSSVQDDAFNSSKHIFGFYDIPQRDTSENLPAVMIILSDDVMYLVLRNVEAVLYVVNRGTLMMVSRLSIIAPRRLDKAELFLVETLKNLSSINVVGSNLILVCTDLLHERPNKHLYFQRVTPTANIEDVLPDIDLTSQDVTFTNGVSTTLTSTNLLMPFTKSNPADSERSSEILTMLTSAFEPSSEASDSNRQCIPSLELLVDSYKQYGTTLDFYGTSQRVVPIMSYETNGDKIVVKINACGFISFILQASLESIATSVRNLTGPKYCVAIHYKLLNLIITMESAEVTTDIVTLRSSKGYEITFSKTVRFKLNNELAKLTERTLMPAGNAAKHLTLQSIPSSDSKIELMEGTLELFNIFTFKIIIQHDKGVAWAKEVRSTKLTEPEMNYPMPSEPPASNWVGLPTFESLVLPFLTELQQIKLSENNCELHLQSNKGSLHFMTTSDHSGNPWLARIPNFKSDASSDSQEIYLSLYLTQAASMQLDIRGVLTIFNTYSFIIVPIGNFISIQNFQKLTARRHLTIAEQKAEDMFSKRFISSSFVAFDAHDEARIFRSIFMSIKFYQLLDKEKPSLQGSKWKFHFMTDKDNSHIIRERSLQLTVSGLPTSASHEFNSGTDLIFVGDNEYIISIKEITTAEMTKENKRQSLKISTGPLLVLKSALFDFNSVENNVARNLARANLIELFEIYMHVYTSDGSSIIFKILES